MTDDVDVAGFNAAEKYAKDRMRDERKMKDMDPLRRPLNELTVSERTRLRNAAGLSKSMPAPPDNAVPFLKHTRFDFTKREKKAKGGYVKKYANGGSVRKVRR
jgi:hypothetical protein|tara:strand:+ start:171 stop:479 length:309 start_codon:yes stop_codon:yes gene_type:complete